MKNLSLGRNTASVHRKSAAQKRNTIDFETQSISTQLSDEESYVDSIEENTGNHHHKSTRDSFTASIVSLLQKKSTVAKSKTQRDVQIPYK